MTHPYTPMFSFVPDCRAAIADGMTLVLSRFEKNAGYPYVNTKLSTLDGADFTPTADPETDFTGPSAVFGWIQGRGLEAIAGHASHLAEKPDLAARCDRMLAVVADRIASLGRANQGRFVFLMTPDGRPFRRGPDGKREYFEAREIPPGFADFFTGKGLAAAGVRLGRADWTDMGIATFRGAMAAVRAGTFASDQISFDARNPAQDIPGRRSQGAWMIALGGYALLCELCPREGAWVEDGCRTLGWILDRHVAKTAGGGLRRHDFVEYTDDAGRPWSDRGRVPQDPGHAIEFTGLAARFLLHARASAPRPSAFDELHAACRTALPEIFLSAFTNGFQRSAGGICKSYDLVARAPINDDMPWWSLPEAMRAAALLLRLAPDHPRRTEVAAAAATCAQALFGRFRSPVPGLFTQTRDIRGDPVPVIPATPDADPGYHTGLCLIDFVNACATLKRVHPGVLK